MTKSTLTLREAAKMAGKGTAAIKAAIDAGRLSISGGGKDADGKNVPYQIDAAELHRVFGLKVNPRTGDLESMKSPKNAEDQVLLRVSDDALGGVLAAKLEATEAMLAEAQKNLDRERDRADRADAERRALLASPRDELQRGREEVQREREELQRERDERARERAEALQREEDRRNEANRLRLDLERARQEQDRLVREADELRQALLKPKGFWSRITGR